MTLIPHEQTLHPRGMAPAGFRAPGAALPDMQQQPTRPPRQSVGSVLWKRRGWFIAGFVLASVAVFIVAPFLPRVYQAHCRFQLVVHNAVVASTRQPLLNFQPLASRAGRTLYQVLTSNTLYALRRKQVAVATHETSHKPIVLQVRVRANSSNPLALRDAVNGAVTQYAAIVRRASRQLRRAAIAAAKRSVATAQAAMAQVHQLRQQFKQVHPGAGASAPNSLLAQYSKLQEQMEFAKVALRVNRDYLKRLAALRAHIKHQGVAVPAPGMAPTAVRKLLVST